jgi:hypothetical protein
MSVVAITYCTLFSPISKITEIHYPQPKKNDRKALAELDSKLLKLNPNNPVKYDFALFGWAF